MKKLSEDGIEYLDGRAIEIYEGKIVGTLELDNEDAIGLSNGDFISGFITLRVGVPKFGENKRSGQLKRQDQFSVVDFTPMDADKAKVVYDNLGTEVQGVNVGLVTVTQITPKVPASLSLDVEETKI